MTVYLVTFATDDMAQSRNLCAISASRHGIGETYAPDAFPPELQRLFEDQRGYGFWLWKPMVINEALSKLRNGDTLVYSDAGVEFIGDISEITRRMDQDIFLFGNNWEHAHWCKRDVVEQVWNQPWSRFGKQAQASVIFFRVSEYSRRFVQEWLKWCLFEGGRLIDDSPSRAPNHPEFREHRHDQAILTTMAYREGIQLHWWPASYNNGAFTYEKLPQYASDTYPVLFNHHRRRNHEWSQVA